ncbi:MAG: type IV pilus twitching motility protein PilT [Candidatus Paceibacterota bacterium]
MLYPLLTSMPEVNLEAVKLLSKNSKAIAVDKAGDVLSVVLEREPTPAEYREIEIESGMLITVSVAIPELWQELRALHESVHKVNFDLGSVMVSALEANASDLHLSAGSKPSIRVNGVLTQQENSVVLSAEDTKNAAEWVGGEKLKGFKGDLDIGFTYANSRWRASIWLQRGSYAITLRLVNSEVPKLESLSLPSSVVSLADVSSGLVLFCGPTGAGKSTSMAALVDRINRTRNEHIITIEDPVEYHHSSIKSSVHQREVGNDTIDFATGLRSALRQDPDVILVGELRDVETMRTALSAAETGHLVLATVHSSTTTGAITRIINSFPAEQQTQIRLQLSGSLQAVVAQNLLRDIRTGRGRVPACEVLIATPAVKTMIRENRLHEIPTVLDTMIASGMTSMDRSLAKLAANKIVSLQEASSLSTDSTSFNEHLKRESTSVGDPYNDGADSD